MPMDCGQKVRWTEVAAPQESGGNKEDSWTMLENLQKQRRTQ